MSQALRKIAGNASKCNCTVMFLNQLRHKARTVLLRTWPCGQPPVLLAQDNTLPAGSLVLATDITHSWDCSLLSQCGRWQQAPEPVRRACGAPGAWLLPAEACRLPGGCRMVLAAAQIGVIYGNPEVTSGGNALKFYASVRVEVRRRLTHESAKGESTGIRVKAKVGGEGEAAAPAHLGIK